MKPVSIIAIAVFALVAVCSSAPVAEQSVESRADIYKDFLSGLFSGLVTTTFGTVSTFLNQLITENPLGVGKRDTEADLAARYDGLTFIYDNILQGLFSGIVSNTFSHLSNTLVDLINKNPLGVGKREVEADLAARYDGLTFIYDNILQGLFSGLVNNTFSHLGNTLLDLINKNPLGVGKRDAETDLAARYDGLTFIYDNILQGLFSGLVTNTFSHLGNTLLDLINKNPLGVGKRADLNVNVFQFLYDNVLSELFGGLASNTANYLQNSLNSLLNKPFGNLGTLGKRSTDVEQAKALVAQAVSTLVATFKTFARQAVASVNDRQKLLQLVQNNIAFIKTTVAQLAHQLSTLIPSTITTEVSHVLAALQSVLVYWTSGLGGSLGPVLPPIQP